MTTVNFHLIAADGQPIAHAKIQVLPGGPGTDAVGTEVSLPKRMTAETDADGKVSLDLHPMTQHPYTLIAADWSTGAKLRTEFYVPESQDPVEFRDLAHLPPPNNKPYDEVAIQSITQDRIWAQESEADAQAAQTAAETAQGLSEAAQAASETAQGLSEAAQAASETAQGLSETARDASQTAQGLSEDARDASQAAQAASETARDKSQDWAEHPEDLAVEPGKYSSLHHRHKAEDAQVASETAQGLSEAARDASQTAQAASETARDASQTAQGLSEAAQASSEAARDLSLQYRNTADSHRQAAGASETAAAASETAAAASESAASTSEANAATSETNAGASEAKAQDWAEHPEDLEVATGQYSSLHHANKSAASAAAAATSEGNAATSESNAATSASNASASESAAATSEGNAAASEGAAALSESNAATSETNAAGSESAAAASEAKADEWANKDRNLEVEPGKYSAKHYMEETAELMVGALVYRGTWDASTGSFPAGPAQGDYYKVGVQGTIATETFRVGDHIVYNGSAWDHIDNTENVATVGGYTGAVTDSQLLTAIKRVNGSGSGLDADLLDGLDSSQFLRTDVDDVLNGRLVFNATNSDFPSHFYHKLYSGDVVYEHAYPSGFDRTRKTLFNWRTADGSGGTNELTYDGGGVLKSNGSRFLYDGDAASQLLINDLRTFHSQKVAIGSLGLARWFKLCRINVYAGSATSGERGYVDIEVMDGRDYGVRGSSGTRLKTQTRAGVVSAQHIHYGNLAVTDPNRSRFAIYNDGADNFWLYYWATNYSACELAVHHTNGDYIVPLEEDPDPTWTEVYTTEAPGTMTLSADGSRLSGVDADKLDGKQLTTIETEYQAYADQAEADAKAHADSIVAPKLDSTSYTAADVLAKAKSVDGAGSGLDADLLDGLEASSFYREVDFANATAGPGWITVAQSNGNREHGEVIVSDSESSDHAFIRIDWLRSYADSNFSVLNVGGHTNRIVGVRVLYETAANTYGTKKLQVQVTVSSDYQVRVAKLGSPGGYGSPNVVTPVLEDSISGYSVHGNALESLHRASLAAEEGVVAGGAIYAQGDQAVFHQGFMGAGSGMDADTLDGKQLTDIEQDAESAAIAVAIALG